MKDLSLSILAYLICLSQSYAQAPQAFSYQGVALDAKGVPVVSKQISLRITILQGSSSGIEVMQETHTPTTDKYGQFSVAIGQGTTVSGSMSAIQWGSYSHYLKAEIDINGGSNYISAGTSQLLSVPYAMYATNLRNANFYDSVISALNARLDSLIKTLTDSVLVTTIDTSLTWSLVTNGDCINMVQGSESNTFFLIRRTDVLKSTDAGSNWTTTNWPLGIVRSGTSALGGAYSKYESGQLAVVTLDNGWYISSDQGASYQQTGPTGFGTGGGGIIALPYSGRFLAGNGGFLRGIYKSSGSDNKTFDQKYAGTDIYGFANLNDSLIFSCGYGSTPLLKSSDFGETWNPLINTLKGIHFIAIQSDSLIMVNDDGSIVVSSWINFNESSPSRFNVGGSNELKRGCYESSDKLLVLTSSNSGISVGDNHANIFKNYTIPNVGVYNQPVIIGDYIYVNTDIGLYRAKYKLRFYKQI